MNNNNVALAGEHAVLSQLNLRGFSAGMTLGNTKGVDILVYYPPTGRKVRVEVKTRLKESYTQGKPRTGFGIVEREWFVSSESEQSQEDLYYCFVHASENGEFEFHIVPSAEVAKHLIGRREYLQSIGKDGGGKFRKFRLGRPSTEYKSRTPYVTDYIPVGEGERVGYDIDAGPTKYQALAPFREQDLAG